MELSQESMRANDPVMITAKRVTNWILAYAWLTFWLIQPLAVLPLHPKGRAAHLALCPHPARDPQLPYLQAGRANAPRVDIRCASVVVIRKRMHADSAARSISLFQSNLRLHFLPV